MIEEPFAVVQIHQLFEDAKLPVNVEVLVTSPKKNKTPEPPVPPTPRVPTARPSAPTWAGVSQEADDLQIYRVTIKNTGSLPVRDVPIRLVFEKPDPNFWVFIVTHKTTPAHEFGEIKEDRSKADSSEAFFSRRFVYELLNPGDEDLVTLLTNGKSELKVYSKAEGVTFNAVAADQGTATRNYNVFFVSMVSGLLALLGAQVAAAYQIHKQRKT